VHHRGDAGVEQRGHRLGTTGRTPVRPVASVRSRSSIIARTTSRSTSGARCRRRASGSASAAAGARGDVSNPGMCRVASAPNPVETPYAGEERRYGLGVAAFEVGSAYLRQDGLERLARPLLRELVDAVGGTAHLGVLDGRDVLYLGKEQGAEPAVLVTEVGVRLPAHLTASGRALLAHDPRRS
jgi:hypothetical protein